jgi:hypothetical protein
MSAVLDYIFEKPQPQQSILLRLRQMVFDAAPNITEKISFKVPFFNCKGWFCYLNVRKKGAVDICFIRGTELSNEQGLLEQKDRKTICSVTFYTFDELKEKEEAMREIIQEAILLNEIKGKPRLF